MPELSQEDIRLAIGRGDIGGVSLDTSIFYKYNLRLTSKGLLSFRQFTGTRTRFVVADTVEFEVRKGLTASVARAFQDFFDASKKLEQFVDSGIVFCEMPDPATKADEIFDEYVAASGLEILGATTYCSISDIQKAYFQTTPPFANKTGKKEEFPDAIALSILEGWAESQQKYVLVASNDSGWMAYCKTSKWLVSVQNVGTMLDLFNRSDEFIVEKVRSILGQPLGGDLEGMVESAIETYAERISLDVDASSPLYFETEDYGAAATGHDFSDPLQIKMLEASKDEFTVSIAITIHLRTEVHVEFLARDEDGAFSLGSDSVEHDFTVPAELLLSADRPGPEGIEFLTCEVIGPGDVHVDLGYLHPFRDE
ncbi:PIN domain-containing protein [Pseudoxanthobacter sp. M-2]|uniref:PIN domain-containing protein n=1 Tax=Pseudoxanthobacter sp. M-2 TaxID=3078754 RepID=UPI0038FCB8E2